MASIEIVFLLIVYISFSCPLSLQVNEKQGKDSSTCLQQNGPPCQSLEYIGDNIQDTTTILTITIINRKLKLKKPVLFSNFRKLTLKGRSYTEIICPFESNYMRSFDGAGMQIMNSSYLTLVNVSIKDCGTAINDSFQNISCALLVQSCTNINLTNVVISNPYGYGMLLLNSSGSIVSDNCTFDNSRDSNSNTRMGGVAIMVEVDEKRTEYKFMNSNFFGNTVAASKHRYDKLGSSNGGGIALYLLAGSANNIINITQCIFKGNTATYGGGLYILCESCNNNTVSISESRFISNTATEGGGMYVAISGSHPHHNNITFIENKIESNNGLYGGGAALSTAYLNYLNHSNNVWYRSCKFLSNHGSISAAVDINRNVRQDGSYYFGVKVNFENCKFSNNVVNKDGNIYQDTKSETGIVFAFQVFLYFHELNVFENNQGTALYMSDADVKVSDARMVFTNNTGDTGGAILLLGDSFIVSDGGNYFVFQNNAASYGGAICAIKPDFRYFAFTETCFLQKEQKYYKYLDVYEFHGNKASTNIANDIFVSNLKPCQYNFKCLKNKPLSTFFENYTECLGNISFEANNLSYATITDSIDVQPNYTAAPGIPVDLMLSQVDQFNKEVGELFPLSANFKEDTSIVIDEHDLVVTSGLIRFEGIPYDSARLLLQSNTAATLRASTVIYMSDCPPGFYLNSSAKICDCFKDNSLRIHCLVFKTEAQVKTGHWAGYLSSNETSETFAVGPCALTFCTFKNQVPHSQFYRLPSTASELETLVCSDHRYGTLCGLCQKGYTTYYNSPTFKCGTENLCSYGILFYILSEIIPVTTFFLVIVVFDIPLISGSLHSFIFYAQTLDVFYISVKDGVKFESFSKPLVVVFEIFYGIFNLKFFNSDSLSFCVFKNLTAMDVFLIQYGTVIYAFFLILVTVCIMKVNSLHMCIKICHKFGRRNIRKSIINGITAVVVLYYFKCLDLFCSILIPANVYVKGRINKTVTLFNGELEYLKGRHWHYAIPAFICLFIIILPPPLFILGNTILQKLTESKRQQNVLFSIMTKLRQKFKPILSSFQKCFRDERQFFAGLFFIYRILLVLPTLFSNSSISLTYVYAEIFLLIILLLHFLFRPFKTSWHNTIDVVLLANLVLVNLITLLNHYTKNIQYMNRNFQTVLEIIQISLISIPAMYIIGFGLWNVFTKFHLIPTLKEKLLNTCWKKLGGSRLRFKADKLEDNPFPARLLQETNDEANYWTFED